MTGTKLFAAACVAAAAILAGPAAASAANRYASPTGTGTACDQVTPCDIVTAINKASAFDDVTIEPGTYSTTDILGLDLSSGFDPKFNLTIHGSPGARPTINFSASSSLAFDITTGSTLRDVDVNVSGNTATGVAAVNGGVVERVYSHATGSDDSPCTVTNESTLRESVCWNSGTSGPNASAVSTGTDVPSFNATNTIRNVTAVTAVGPGLRARSSASTDSSITVNAINVFVRGGGGAGGEDVRTERLFTGSTPTQQVNLDHSNFVTTAEQDTGDVTDPGTGTNVTTAPAFVNAAAGNFHEQETSTGTLNLGTATGLGVGETDLDGAPRVRGSAPDIGAYELPQVPLAPTLTGTTPPSGTNDNNPRVTGSAESGSQVAIYPNGTCSGAPAASGPAATFASPGISVTVADNSTTTFSATAANEVGPSPCSTVNLTYSEISPASATPLPSPPSSAKKKCKKRKHRAASAKKCRKKRK